MISLAKQSISLKQMNIMYCQPVQGCMISCAIIQSFYKEVAKNAIF